MTASATRAEVSPARGGDLLRRNRTAVAVGAVAFLVLLLTAWFGRDDASYPDPLDPQNAGPDGSRALAHVLRDHGVPVTIARGRDALADARVDDDTVVAITNPGDLGAGTWREVGRRARDAHATLVVVGLGEAVADDLHLTREPRDVGGRVRASCDVDLVDDLVLDLEFDAPGVPGAGCFGHADARLLLVDRTAGRWLLTTGEPLTNAALDDGDNAALAVRLLGQASRVVWYVADPADQTADEAFSIGDLLPRWLVPSLWLVGAAAVAFLLWRGRRLGPLTVEPLPVTVRALEATTTQARLYEKSGDRLHAAALLVAGTARRLTEALGLPPTTPYADLVLAVAARTRRPVNEIRSLLPDAQSLPARAGTDRDLLDLAQSLHALEEEVHPA